MELREKCTLQSCLTGVLHRREWCLILSIAVLSAYADVDLRVNLDRNFGLNAKKVVPSHCVEVCWIKADSGACSVQYTVTLKSTSGDDVYSVSGNNFGEVKLCSLPTNINITDVQLTVTFKTTSKIVRTRVFEAPAKIGVPKTPGNNILSSEELSTMDFAFLAVIALLMIIIIIITIAIIMRRKRTIPSETQRKESRGVCDVEKQYTQLDVQSREPESLYVRLEGEYDDVVQGSSKYINVLK